MMFYAKHPTLGNKHFAKVNRAAMEAEGWVFWPRSKAEKEGIAPVIVGDALEVIEIAPDTVEVVEPKRKPGRPKKV